MSVPDQHYDYLFLSPHLDDVVLSCSLRLLQALHQGKSVLVATVFSSAIRFWPGCDLYSGRQREDKDALKTLGINNPLWLGYSDAPFRNLFYTSFRSIVMGSHDKDSFFSEKIAKSVVSLCQKYTPETVFIPLAVGTHIDHRLTHHIWCNLPSNTNIVFYEDRPYVFLPHSLLLRLAEIGAKEPEPTLFDSFKQRHRSLRAFADGLKNVTLYKSFLTRKNERFRYILWAARKLRLPSKESQLNIQPQIITTDSKEDVTKIEMAISAYTSQMKALYNNIDTFRQESATYMRTLDPSSIYAERYWRLIR